jgi:hypothetical protein
MTKSKVYQYYTELPPWAKGIVVVGGMAILYFASKSIFRKLNEAKISEDSREAVKDAESDKSNLIRGGVKASYTKTQYQTWANSIQQAFEGCDYSAEITWGSDSPIGLASIWSSSGYKVAAILNQLKNNVDYLELTTAWGIRSYDACGYFSGDIKNVDLSKAIQSELTAREISNLNKILSGKGITYML